MKPSDMAGKKVRGVTLDNQTDAIPGRTVEGVLTIRHIPGRRLAYDQYWVSGQQVDPDSVREIDGQSSD